MQSGPQFVHVENAVVTMARTGAAIDRRSAAIVDGTALRRAVDGSLSPVPATAAFRRALALITEAAKTRTEPVTSVLRPHATAQSARGARHKARKSKRRARQAKRQEQEGRVQEEMRFFDDSGNFR